MEKTKKTPKEEMMNMVEEREKYGQILPKYGQHAISKEDPQFPT